MIAIKYIGRHLTHKENIYGTGVTFEKGETKLFSDDIAAKLLKHPDVYALDNAKPDVKLKKPEVVEVKDDTEEDDRIQHALDAKKTIAKMTDAQLRAYAATKFNHEFDDTAKIADMKRYLNTKINIAGV